MRILCVTSVKNEAPFLLEWVAHQMVIGVTDFLIFSNDCDDGTHEILQELHRTGLIEHIPQTIEPGQSPQWLALRAAWKHPLRKACDWALVCDVDEFTNIHIGQGTIPELVQAVPDNTDGILLPWRLFGNNDIAFFEDKPVTQQFTRSMVPECNYPVSATFFKSLIRTNGPFNQFGVHRPKQKSAEKAGLPNWVNGAGHPMPKIFSSRAQRLSLHSLPNGRDLVECNHYSLKSAESFLVKRDRGLPNRSEKNIDLSYWIDRNFNTAENHSIKHTTDKMLHQLTQLLLLPNLQKLHDDGVQWHKAKFLEMMKQEANHSLFSQVMVAGSSQCPPANISNQIINWYQHIHRQKMAAKEASTG